MDKILTVAFLYILIFTVFTPAAFADVIEPGMKNIHLNYKISNIDDYPEYVFLAHGIPDPPFEVLNSSEFSFYKLSTVSLYAIPKSKINEGKFNNIDDEELQNFFKNNQNIIPSDIELNGSYGQVGIDNPLDNVLIELEITSITDNKMNIKKSKVIYTYSDGSTQEEVITDQNALPQPEKNILSYVWYFLVPVIAIAIIGVILYLRRQNKSKF